jgi:hypothetical protein
VLGDAAPIAGQPGMFRYTVTRNVQGTGAKAYTAGDAVVSYAGNAVGEGFIELTSTNTVQNHLGPTITVYARSAITNWNDVKPVTTMGNLRSFVGAAADIYGFALGNDISLTPAAGFSGMVADTAGLRMYNISAEVYLAAEKILQINPTGGINIYATPGSSRYDYSRAYSFSDATTQYAGLFSSYSASVKYLELRNYSNTTLPTETWILSLSDRGNAVTRLTAQAGGKESFLSLESTYNGVSEIELGADKIVIVANTPIIDTLFNFDFAIKRYGATKLLLAESSIDLTGPINITGNVTLTTAGAYIETNRIRSAANNTLYFTHNDGTEYARFTPTGRLGLGTNNPAGPLHLVGTTDGVIAQMGVDDGLDNVQFVIYGYTSDYTVNTYLTDSVVFYASTNTPKLVLANANSAGTIVFTTGGAPGSGRERLSLASTGAIINCDSGGTHHIRVNGSNKMSIGHVGTNGQFISIPFDPLKFTEVGASISMETTHQLVAGAECCLFMKNDRFYIAYKRPSGVYSYFYLDLASTNTTLGGTHWTMHEGPP